MGACREHRINALLALLAEPGPKNVVFEQSVDRGPKGCGIAWSDEKARLLIGEPVSKSPRCCFRRPERRLTLPRFR